MKTFALTAASISSCMSVYFLFGWHLDLSTSLQPPPSTWPIPYLSALSFLLSGFALFSLFSSSRFPLSKIFGLAILFLGFQRMMEFFFSEDFRVNFIANKIFLHPIHSSQMTFTGAIGFFLVGMIFTLWPKHKPTLIKDIFILALSSLIVFLGALGVFLSILPIQLEKTPNKFIVHFYTGVGLFIIGSCFVYCRQRLNPANQRRQNQWLKFVRRKPPT